MRTAWLALLATLVLLTSYAASAQAAGQWTATGAMVNEHMWHAATLLAPEFQAIGRKGSLSARDVEHRGRFSFTLAPHPCPLS